MIQKTLWTTQWQRIVHVVLSYIKTYEINYRAGRCCENTAKRYTVSRHQPSCICIYHSNPTWSTCADL